MNFPGGSVSLLAIWETQVHSESGGSPGEGNGNTLQVFLPEESMDRGAWWTTVHGVTKSRTELSEETLALSFPPLKVTGRLREMKSS